MSSPAARPATPPKSRRMVLLVGALVLVGLVLVISDRELAAGARRIVAIFVDWLRSTGPWAFFAGMAVLPAFGFPLFPFTIAAGPAFGETLGASTVALCAGGAVAVNVTLSYWLARGVLRRPVEALLARLGYHVPAAPEGTAWHFAFIVRLVPGPPFWVQSYLLGLMRLPVVPYTIASVAVPALYIVGVVFGGEALWTGRTKVGLMAFAAVGVLACGLALWRRLRRRRNASVTA